MGKENKTDTCANALSYAELNLQSVLEWNAMHTSNVSVVCCGILGFNSMNSLPSSFQLFRMKIL